MNLKEVIGRRILVVEKSQHYNSKSTIEELKILEISPSEKWIKIQNMNGTKFWKPITDINPIEVLNPINEGKPNN